MLKLYNTLTRSKQEFAPLSSQVKMYSCGPTVYSYPHIGNMRAYIFVDSLRRVLKYNSYDILGVMNITDVGHLTSDEDTGEDKMELAAKKENKSPYEISRYYTDIFLKYTDLLNIDMPEHILKATENVDIMIELIQKIEAGGYTYRLDDGIYFDVQKFQNYGRLSNKNLNSCHRARIEENINKRHPFDFALWKFVSDNHVMKWDSPWGVGCPGWAIECSAMGMKILGENIDIHTGGIDHSTVHHENEIAQNESAVGHQVVRFWMHNQWLLLKGGKMSKSLGNIHTLDSLAKLGFSAMDFKYLCHTTHYRKPIYFDLNTLSAAQTAINNMQNMLIKHKNGKTKIKEEFLNEYKNCFLQAINDDLNIPKALGVAWNLLNNNPCSTQVYNLMIEFDKVFGLQLKEYKPKTQTIPDEIVALAKQRQQARIDKDFKQSDEMRLQILNKGYCIKDLPDNNFELEKTK